MNLVAYTATALSRNDIEDTPTNKNVVDFAIVELKDLNGDLVVIYDDETGSNPETQKTCDTNGQVTFFAEIGDYNLEINGKSQRINLSSGLAGFISTKTDESVQDFIDSFALKIFQSPTDGVLTEIQTRTVDGNEVYEVRKASDNSLTTIYSDVAGTTEIAQNGTDNKSDGGGVIEFYVGYGEYSITSGLASTNFNASPQEVNYALANAWGVNGDGSDESEKLLMAMNYSKSNNVYLDLLGKEVVIDGDFVAPDKLKVKNGTIKFNNSSVTLRFNNSSKIEDITIDANGADYALQEVVTSGITTGLKYSTLKNVICKNALISDFYLQGYHFLMTMSGCQSASPCSSFGFDLKNINSIANPDVIFENCYVNNPSKGYSLVDVTAVMIGCSADNCSSTPLNAVNSFVELRGCGFEQTKTWMSITSSTAYFSNCTISTGTGTMADDGGNKAFIRLAGGTYPGAVKFNGGILLNQSDDEISAIRVLSTAPAAIAELGSDIEFRENTNPINKFTYQSDTSPNAGIAKICKYGSSRFNPVSAGFSTTQNEVFQFYFNPSSEFVRVPATGVLRFVDWGEFGSNTAGSSTTANLIIYNSDFTVRDTVSNCISISGGAVGGVKRNGTTIIDIDINAGEFLKFELSSAGERSNTGITATLTIDY